MHARKMALDQAAQQAGATTPCSLWLSPTQATVLANPLQSGRAGEHVGVPCLAAGLKVPRQEKG